MPKLKAGIVGPEDLVEQIKECINPSRSAQIEFQSFVIRHVEETRSLDRRSLDQCDLLLFAGQMAQKVYLESGSETAGHNSPDLVSIKYDGSALFKAFYELALEMKGELSPLTPFTIDVLTPAEVRTSFRDLGLETSDFIAVEGESAYSTAEWADLHERFYRNSESRCALTCLTSVAAELAERDIPVKRIIPPTASINAALDVLYAKAESHINALSQATAILLTCKETDRRPKNRYSLLRQQLKFQEAVVDFCETHDASLTFPNENQAKVFINKAVCKELTDDFRSFPLLKELEAKTGYKVFAGIGIGNDVSEAEYHAEKAMKFAGAKKDPSAYAVFPNGEIIGPLIDTEVPPLLFSTSLNNENLERVSSKSNLSGVTISRLMSLLQKKNTTKLTVHQLAEAFDISLRAASRILKQLDNAGFAVIIGEEQPAGRGRPRKIYELNLDRVI